MTMTRTSRTTHVTKPQSTRRTSSVKASLVAGAYNSDSSKKKNLKAVLLVPLPRKEVKVQKLSPSSPLLGLLASHRSLNQSHLLVCPLAPLLEALASHRSLRKNPLLAPLLETLPSHRSLRKNPLLAPLLENLPRHQSLGKNLPLLPPLAMANHLLPPVAVLVWIKRKQEHKLLLSDKNQDGQ